MRFSGNSLTVALYTNEAAARLCEAYVAGNAKLIVRNEGEERGGKSGKQNKERQGEGVSVYEYVND